MCAGCFIHLLADARLKEEQATCPNCRCEISKSLCCRNLAVEKAVSELPSDCSYCLKQFPRSSLDHHQSEECQDRYTQTYPNSSVSYWETHASAPHQASNYSASESCESCLVLLVCPLWFWLWIGLRNVNTSGSAVRGRGHSMSSLPTRLTAATHLRLASSWWASWRRWIRAIVESYSSTTASLACSASRRSASQVHVQTQHTELQQSMQL